MHKELGREMSNSLTVRDFDTRVTVIGRSSRQKISTPGGGLNSTAGCNGHVENDVPVSCRHCKYTMR